MEETRVLLKMTDICKSFPGVKALDNAQLSLRSGSVHALMGENGAGKSTLMKCLFGIYKKDSGKIEVEGEGVHFVNPRHALNNGVAMVHQELNQVLRRSVMENVWLGRFPMKGIFVDHKKMYNDTLQIFRELEIDVDPKEIICNLSVSKRQMVEIAKAVSYSAKIVVMDEPTSSLTDEEVRHLFRILKKLCDNGVGVIYISHKMDEILEISDEVTVMRDGQWVATRPAEELTSDEIISLMVNRDMEHRFPPKDNEPGDALLECDGITGKYMPSCIDVSFALRKGEILGVAGLVGSQRTELLNTLFGTMSRGAGTIKLHGKQIQNKHSGESIKNGFALITEERRATGLFPEMNLNFNSTIANIDKYLRFGLVRSQEIRKDTDWVIENLKVKTVSSKVQIKNLSGGNQQKVIIGRWLLTQPDVLLLDEPTRGIDVGAKYEIYQLIFDLAKQGKGIMMVSSEMPELLGICDRIMVMSNGRLSGILERGKDFGGVENEQETIMRLSAQYV